MDQTWHAGKWERRLQKIYPFFVSIKEIPTLDEDPEADYEGIRGINAPEWLAGITDLR